MRLSWQTRGGGGGEETNWKVYVHVSFNGPFSRKWALKFSSRQESRVSLLINEDWNRSNDLWDGKPFSSRVIHARRFSRPTGLLLSDNQISTPTYSSSHCKKNFWSSNCDRLEVFTFFHRLFFTGSNNLSIGEISCTDSFIIIQVVRYSEVCFEL